MVWTKMSLMKHTVTPSLSSDGGHPWTAFGVDTEKPEHPENVLEKVTDHVHFRVLTFSTVSIASNKALKYWGSDGCTSFNNRRHYSKILGTRFLLFRSSTNVAARSRYCRVEKAVPKVHACTSFELQPHSDPYPCRSKQYNPNVATQAFHWKGS